MISSNKFKINKNIEKYKIWRSKVVGDFLLSNLWMDENYLVAMSYLF